MRAPPLIITQQNPQNYFGKLRLKVEHVVQLDEEIPIASAEEEDRLFHQIPVGSEVARVAAGRLLFAQVVPFLFQERLSFVKLKKKESNGIIETSRRPFIRTCLQDVLRRIALVLGDVNVDETVDLKSGQSAHEVLER